MTVKIEFPADNKALAGALGKALCEYAGGVIMAVPDDLASAEKSNGDFSQEQIDNVVEEKAHDVVAINDELQEALSDSLTDNTAGAQSDAMVDEKNVMFIPAVCANAKDPFYSSGPRKGQWKKKRGVSDEEYDAAYNNALSMVNGGAGSQTQTTNASTGPSEAEQAFGNPAQQQQQPQNNSGAIGPQQVFELYQGLVQAGKAEAANQACAKHGIANGTLIFSRPDLAQAVFNELTQVQ